MPYFRGGVSGGSDSYIQLPPLVLRRDEFAAIFEIRPEGDTGLIMYSGSAEDFISLAMRAGKLELRYGRVGRACVSTVPRNLRTTQTPNCANFNIRFEIGLRI